MAPMDLNPKETVPVEKRTEHLVCKRCGSEIDLVTGRCTDKTCGLIQRRETQTRDKFSSSKTAGVPPTKQTGTHYYKATEAPTTAPQYICPNCGTNVGIAQGRCPNQRGCGYSGFMKRRDFQPATRDAEATKIPESAQTNYQPTAKTFLSEIGKTSEIAEPYTPKTQSPLLHDIEETRGHEFPKGEKQFKPKEYSEPREWHFPTATRFARPVLTSLLLLLIAAALVFVVIRIIIPAASQLANKPTSPSSIASTTTLPASYTLNVERSPQEGGTISMFPDEEAYPPDTEIKLTAVAASGYTFDHWKISDILENSPNITISMDSDKNITAYFVADNVVPTISEVQVTDIADISATVMWTTSESTTGYVDYGKTDRPEETVQSTSGEATDHIARLMNLAPRTKYHVWVRAKDLGGNEALVHTTTFTTSSAISIGNEIGKRAPNFTLPSYRDDAPDSPNNPDSPNWQETVSLNALRGKKVIVNFWSSYCGACLLEFPIIRNVYQEAEWANMNESSELAVITVCIDGRDDRIPKLEDKFSEQVGRFTFPILLDKENIINRTPLIDNNRFNVQATPTTVFIDKEGIIKHIKVGAFQTIDEVKSILDSF